MRSIKLPKNELGRVDESNLGHTKDEWENQKETPKVCAMDMYDVKWNMVEEND